MEAIESKIDRTWAFIFEELIYIIDKKHLSFDQLFKKISNNN